MALWRNCTNSQIALGVDLNTGKVTTTEGSIITYLENIGPLFIIVSVCVLFIMI